MIEFDPSGLISAVEEMAQQVIDSVDEDTLRATGFAGAEVFRDQAKQNALKNKKTGVLYDNIIIKRLTEESEGGKRQVYLVTVRKGPRGGSDAYYWRWVEDGHKIVGENKNVDPATGRKTNWKAHREEQERMRREAEAAEFGSATVPPNPFMRPAYESKKHEAVDVMTQKLAELLARNSS